MRVITLYALSLTFVMVSLAPVALFATDDQLVSSSEVSLAQIRESSSKTTTVACVAKVPGVVISNERGLYFRSYADLIKQAERRGRNPTRYLLLNARGRRACAKKTISLDGGINRMAAFTGRMTTLGASTGSIFASALRTQTTGLRKTVEDLFGQLENLLKCSSVSLRGGKLIVDFGTGCNIRGRNLIGSFTASPDLSGSSIGATLTLTEISDGSNSISGSVSVMPLGGSADLNSVLTLTSNGIKYSGTFAGTLTIDGASLIGDGFTVDGTGTLTGAALSGSYKAEGLHKSATSSCYPDAGVIAVALNGLPRITVTFSSTTTTSGIASVQYGNAPSQSLTLPACALPIG